MEPRLLVLSPHGEADESLNGHGDHYASGETEHPAESAISAREAAQDLESPFISEFVLNQQLTRSDPTSEAFVEFLRELHDEEFDDVLYELVAEATDVAARYQRHEQGRTPTSASEIEALLEEHFAPVQDEFDGFLAEVGEAIAAPKVGEMSEPEFDDFLESFAPRTDHLSPSIGTYMEAFWGKIKKAAKKAWKKTKKVAKKAVKAVGSLALKALWPKLRKVARSLLKRVLKYALKKVPKRYRPLARTLAKRYGLLREVQDELLREAGEDEGFFAIQSELDTLLTGLVETEDDAAFDIAVHEFEMAAPESMDVDLAAARERFVRQLGELEEGDDPTPVIEEYAQAILMAVRLGIKLIGRKRVVNFLAKYLARLIRKWVGRRAATPLARVIVDAGLRLLKLEVRPEDELDAAHYALASLVEDTVRAVANLPEHLIDDEALLEAEIVRAMEEAAASNLPQMLSKHAYRNAPHLRESVRLKGTWILLPLRRRRRYKKYSQPQQARVTPHVAKEVATFGGQRLDEFLRDQAGVELGDGIDARVHLYEVIDGADASDIARGEADVPGLGGSYGSWSRLHPLTPEAAGMLLQEPGLGRAVEPEHLADPRHLSVGQRLYFLEIPGAYRGIGVGVGRERMLPRSSDVAATLDFPGREIRLGLYLGESEAQDLLRTMKGGLGGKRVPAALRKILKSRLRRALRDKRGRGMRVIHRSRIRGRRSRRELSLLPEAIQDRFAEELDNWTTRAFVSELARQEPELQEALEHEADGVTLTAIVHAPPGMSEMESALGGEPVRLGSDWMVGPTPQVSLRVESGRGEEAR